MVNNRNRWRLWTEIGRASRLRNVNHVNGMCFAARMPESRLAALSHHGGHRRTHPNGGGKKPRIGGKKGADTSSW